MNTTDNAYHRQTAHAIATIAQCLPDMPKERLQEVADDTWAAKQILQPLKETPSYWKRWAQIKTPENQKTTIHSLLTQHSVCCDTVASDEIEHWSTGGVTSRRPKIVAVVKTTPKDLGFIEPAPRNLIYSRAEELGLLFTTPDTTIVLRCQYFEQPEGEVIEMTRNPKLFVEGQGVILSLESKKDRLLIRGQVSCLDDTIPPYRHLVFERPR